MKYQSPRFSLFKAKNRARRAGETQFFMSDYAEKKGRERGNIENKGGDGKERVKKKERKKEKRREKERQKWRERHILRGRVGHASPSISTSCC